MFQDQYDSHYILIKRLHTIHN